jgi:hypothetical protein
MTGTKFLPSKSERRRICIDRIRGVSPGHETCVPVRPPVDGWIVKASDRRKTHIADPVVHPSARLHRGRVKEKGWNMPALREISFEYARQIASVKGLQPSKVRGTSTLRFTKGGSDKLQVITWDEFINTANSRNLAVYESGGWMKLMRKH